MAQGLSTCHPDAPAILPAVEAKGWLEKMKPVAVAAVRTPVSYAPFKDPNCDGAIAYIWAEDDSIVTPELRQSYLDKSGITLTRSVKGGHGIDLEAREDVVKNVVELVEHFESI
ncbi:uncharacterized protein N0V89_001012 [Didymosphaeria variabile]|uniref:AB hydrolase-1 domain-containing protein n=1 Tax=Didymosphaeria variabile TaxID=1932322 RepID=A0A9W8XYI6_9PLEO|nr:uncharacterized protein N0V89_001012 [Didymosphaeria variabile]KAJ4360449.1 hypothetical protein N0V89_001012 [Didymosphaeria variabile]